MQFLSLRRHLLLQILHKLPEFIVLFHRSVVCAPDLLLLLGLLLLKHVDLDVLIIDDKLQAPELLLQLLALLRVLGVRVLAALIAFLVSGSELLLRRELLFEVCDLF